VDLRLLGVYLTCAFDPHDEGDHHAVLSFAAEEG
jgi:hypothetical protein